MKRKFLVFALVGVVGIMALAGHAHAAEMDLQTNYGIDIGPCAPGFSGGHFVTSCNFDLASYGGQVVTSIETIENRTGGSDYFGINQPSGAGYQTNLVDAESASVSYQCAGTASVPDCTTIGTSTWYDDRWIIPSVIINGSGNTFLTISNGSYDLRGDRTSGLPYLILNGTYVPPQPPPPPPPPFLATSSLRQYKSDATTTESTAIFEATLRSFGTSTSQLQVELEPSYVSFKNQPNLVSIFVASGSVASVSTSSLSGGAYHWQARAWDSEDNLFSPWQTSNNPPESVDFIVYDPSSDIIMRDNATGYGVSTEPNPCFGDGSIFSCALSPAFNNYVVGYSFPISKITFNWRNSGGNNCDGMGVYGAIITSANATNSIVATSTGGIYMGCAGFYNGTGGAGELDFAGQTIPSSFYLTFGAFDGALQGGSQLSVTNVTVYSAVQKEPVVIVPGIMGSELNRAADGEEVWPNAAKMLFSGSDDYLDDLKLSANGAETTDLATGDIVRQELLAFSFYQNLIQTLKANGYVESSTLFVAPYDWRMSVASSAAEIAPILARAASRSPDGKVNVIAHSMGGLVMKEYLTGHATSSIDRLILAGVPQLGAPEAFKLLEYGDDLGLNFFGIGLNQDKTRDISANMPGVYDLLPSRRYLAVNGGYVKDMRNGQAKVFDYDGTNALTPNAVLASGADGRHQAIDTDQFDLDPSRVYNIMGCRTGTLGEVRIYDGGKYGIGTTNGDGTVPLTSAFNLSNSYHNFFALNEDHTGLIKNDAPLALMLAIVNASFSAGSASIQVPSGIAPSLSDCLSLSSPSSVGNILVSVSGPAELQVYDEAGDHTGPNDASGTVELGIPGSSYHVIGKNAFAVLPASSTYQIVAQANTSGTIDMSTEELDGVFVPKKKTTYLSVPVKSSKTKAKLKLTAASSSPQLVVDDNGDNTLTTAYDPTATLDASTSKDIAPPVLSMPALPLDPILNSTTTFIFSATDTGSGIASIKGFLNNAPVNSGQVITLTQLGINTFHLEAKDKAGNPSVGEETFTVVAAPAQTTTTTTTPFPPRPDPRSISFFPSADTYVREWSPNKNQGIERTFRIREVGSNRALIKFDDAALRKTLGTSTILSAKLQFTVAANGNNWGKGREVDILRMTRDWSERGATWNCASDTNTLNAIPNCPGGTWSMLGSLAPFVTAPTASTTITNKTQGTVTFDVTRDLTNMLRGTVPDYGWIFKKADEKISGLVEFASRETARGPKLVVQYQP